MIFKMNNNDTNTEIIRNRTKPNWMYDFLNIMNSIG